MGGSLGAKIFNFFVCVCVCCFGLGWSEVLIKYTENVVTKLCFGLFYQITFTMTTILPVSIKLYFCILILRPLTTLVIMCSKGVFW